MTQAPILPDKLPHVYIALPARPGENISLELAVALQKESQGEGFKLWGWRATPCSLLTTNFNHQWVLARNLRTAWLKGYAACRQGVKRSANPVAERAYGGEWYSGWDEAAGMVGPGPLTDWIMVHSDVAPIALDSKPMRWIQDAVEERRRAKADVLSAVIPLKDDSGKTSTAVMNWQTKNMRPLCLEECLPPNVPETFSIASLAHGNEDVRRNGGDCLLINTGYWIADLAGAWTRRICFRIYDTIIMGDDGYDEAQAVGEDYLFSMDLYRLGLRVCATTKFTCNHAGTWKWPNYVAYGKGERDKWGQPWCVEPPLHWNYMTAVPPRQESSVA